MKRVWVMIKESGKFSKVFCDCGKILLESLRYFGVA